MTAYKQFIYTILLLLLLLLLLACLILNWHTQRVLNKPAVFHIRGRSLDFYRSIMINCNDYDAIITGSSMSANFKCSEFDILFGTQSLKTAKGGASVADFCIVCDYSLKLRPVKYVLVDLGMSMTEDVNINGKYYSDAFQRMSFVQESFSLENTIRSLRFCFSKPKTISRDDYSSWYKEIDNPVQKLARIAINANGELVDSPNNYSNEKIQTSVDSIDKLMLPLFNKYPQTTFLVFFPPFSMLHYYQQSPEQIIKYKTIVCNRLLSCPNVKLYDFQSVTDITENLVNYQDYTHYMEHINSWIIEQIAKDNYLITQENMNTYLDKLKNSIANYNFNLALEQLKSICPEWEKRDSD